MTRNDLIRTVSFGNVTLSCMVLLSFVSGLALASQSSFAKDDPSSVYIEVRKTPETLKKIPASVLVIDKKQLSQEQIKSPTDIALATPSFSFNDPFGRFNPAPSIRGLIQPGLGDDPSVGFFTDGLYVSGRSSINSLNFDLARVEVSKGPQNALYGRNSFSGAINAINNKPEKDVSQWIDVSAGTKNRYEAEYGITGAITDTVSSRLAVYLRDFGGFYKNQVNGGPDIGRETTKAFKFSTLIEPNAKREIHIRLAHGHDDDSQPKGFLVAANCGPRIPGGALRLYCGDLPAQQNPYSANDVGTEQEMGYQRDHTRGSLEWREFLSDRLTLTTLLGGSFEDSVFIRDDDYQAVNAARAGVDTERHDLQFDTRLNKTSANEKTKGLIGISAYRFNNRANRIDQLYVSGQTSPGGARVKNDTDTLALYGSFTQTLPHYFGITLDGRLQYEQKSLSSSTLALSTSQPIVLSDSWTDFSPKLTLFYDKPTLPLVYSSIARGYKSGGFNDRANLFDSERTYAPETNITYEVGVKNIRLQDKISFDVNGFWIDWQDQQVLAYSSAGTTQNFFLNNAGQSTSKGFETLLNWQAADTVSVSAGYAFIDAEYDSYNDPDLRNVTGFTPNGNVAGKKLPRHSPHQATLSALYKKPLGVQDLDLVIGTQYRYESSQFTDNSNTARTDDRHFVNLQAGVERGSTYSGIYVNNLFNERDPAVGIPWTDASQGFRREWLVVPEDGITAGIRFKTKF